MKIILDKETYDYLISKLEEANEWAHKHNELCQMDFIQDVTYEALVCLKEKEFEYANRTKNLK